MTKLNAIQNVTLTVADHQVISAFVTSICESPVLRLAVQDLVELGYKLARTTLPPALGQQRLVRLMDQLYGAEFSFSFILSAASLACTDAAIFGLLELWSQEPDEGEREAIIADLRKHIKDARELPAQEKPEI